METKVCKRCGEELPLAAFRATRAGGLTDTCKACIVFERQQNRQRMNSSGGGGKQPPFSDPDFDGKEPGEVWRLMCRAKRWLDSRGYAIRLDGEYREVKVRKLKFQ